MLKLTNLNAKIPSVNLLLCADESLSMGMFTLCSVFLLCALLPLFYMGNVQ